MHGHLRPGATHLLTGMYDAHMDHVPLLAIVGQQARNVLGAHYQQEFDLTSVFKDVAAYVQQASSPAQVRHIVDRAMRIAKAERKVSAIILPNDLQDVPYEGPVAKHGNTFSGIGYTAPKVVPYDADLRRAADVLNAGKKVAILVGAGALNATDEVIAIADKLRRGRCKGAPRQRPCSPMTCPWVTGINRLAGHQAQSYDMMTECDTLLMIGSGFPYSEFLPEGGAGRARRSDRCQAPDMLSLALSDGSQPLQGDSPPRPFVPLLPLLDQPDRTAAPGATEASRKGWTTKWWEDPRQARARGRGKPTRSILSGR